MRTRLTIVSVLIAVFVLGISVQAQWPTSVLIEALSSSDRKARELAATMLGERGTPAEAVEPLIKALGDSEWSVRLAVTIALGKCKDPRAVEPLSRVLLNDSEPHVRAFAALALGNIGDARAVAPLNQARTDADENVRAAAMESLRLINSAAKPAVPASQPRTVQAQQTSGDVVVFFEVTPRGGSISHIVAERIARDGRVLWGEMSGGMRRPVLVENGRNSATSPVAVADGQGGAFVFFELDRAQHGTAIAGQHIDAYGRLQWGDGQKPIGIAIADNIERHPVAVPDGAGGAIVVFETELTSGKYKGDIDISAQRVAADGRLLWGPSNKPASVANPVGMDRNPVAIPDGDGGAIIAWEHEPTEGEDAGDTDIFAQRMDAKGRGMWLGGKKAVALLASKLSERAPAIVPDGKGGAIVICEAESRTGKDAGDIDLLAQRISADGTKLWNEGKSSQRIASSQWRERWPVAVPDGEGGAFVVYTALGVGQDGGDIDIEIKRLDGSGKLLWNEGKVPVDVAATKDLERNPRMVVVSK